MSSGPTFSASRRSNLLRGFLVVALLAMAALYYWRPRPVPLEVPRAALELRLGKLFLTNSSAPFTGVMTEKSPNGQMLSRSMIVNGMLNGRSQGFYTNGQVQVIEHFRDGQSEGKREKFYPNGAKMSEATIHEGKIVGVFRRWYENGALAEEVEMADGVPNGNSVAYYQSGFMKAETRHEKGKLVHQKFWNEGEGRRVTNNVRNAG